MKRIVPCCKHCFLLLLFFLLAQISHAQPNIAYEPVITSGLNIPMELKSAPGDVTERLFVVERGGTIKIWNGSSLLPTPFLNIAPLITNSGEQGLLSMAFHPDYSTNGFFYLYYNNTEGDITVSKFKVSDDDPNVAEPDTIGDPLVEIEKAFTNHNGGHLQFRPDNGTNYLYFGTGDGGSGNDPGNNAQNPASLLGKMIRVDVDAASYNPEIWSVGLRNPFRWSFDRDNGDMWIGDVGQDAIEEISYLEGGIEGANFGWRCFEGTRQNTDVDPLCDPPGKIPPVFEYSNPSEGRSVVGGYVFRGDNFSALQGYYLATDFYTGTLWLMRKNGASFDITTAPNVQQGVTSISETEDGTLYLVCAPSLASTPGPHAVYRIVNAETTPLQLTHFSGVSNTGFNNLTWTTTMEYNIGRFAVEYSTNGTSYTQAAVVEATNSLSGASYSYRHTVSTGEKVYYRLRIEELDGKLEYSAVITVGGNTTNDIKVYPTIINNNILQVNSFQRINSLHVLSMEGREVFSKKLNNSNGYFTVTLPGLQKGNYIVRLMAAGMLTTKRIVIQ